MKALLLGVALLLAWGLPVGARPEDAATAAPSAEVPTETPVVDADPPVDDEAPAEVEVETPPATVAPVDGSLKSDNLMSVGFVDRVYFKEETIRGYVYHQIPATLDREVLDADAARIEDQFKDRGFLRADVSVKLSELPLGGYHADFVIRAGARAELKRVDIIGQKLVTEAQLKEGLFSRAPEPFGLFTRAGFFHRPYLDQDAQRVVANFYKYGFLEARVQQSTITADNGLDGLNVVMHVYEGPQYELSKLVFAGDIPAGETQDSLASGLSVKVGDICNLVAIQTESDKLLEGHRAAGFPFAAFQQAVVPAPAISKRADRRGVAITLTFVKGEAPRVRHIKVVGNTGTRPHVIMRDVVIHEGEPYNHAAVKETERLLMRTGFFAAVVVKPVATEDPKLVDLEVGVTEVPTWLLSLAPAYDATANGEGGILVGLAGERNLLGFGFSTMLMARLSQKRQTFDASFTDPRVLDTRIQATAELHRREIGFGVYRTRSEVGGGVRANFPVLETGLFFGLSVAAEYGGVLLYDKDHGDAYNGPRLNLSAAGDYGLFPAQVFRNPLRASVVFDKRDSVLSPRNGIYADASVGYAGPLTLSGLAFLDGGASFKGYWSPFWQITFKTNTDVGAVINPHGGVVAVTDRYFLGGLGSVRGYGPLTLGPLRQLQTRDGVVATPIGGVVRAAQNFEIEFPLWPDTPFRGFVFLDMGNAFGEGELGKVLRGQDLGRDVNLPLGMFMSTGFGVLIVTPVLPFRLEWSVPLTRRNYDQPFNFFLGIGSAF